jgi:hypothetical protein
MTHMMQLRYGIHLILSNAIPGMHSGFYEGLVLVPKEKSHKKATVRLQDQT